MHRLVLLVCLAASSGCRSMPDTTFSDGPRIVHAVFFDLLDDSEVARAALVDDCYALLGDLPGVLSLQAGPRCEALAGEVNDQAFDVALHVVFTDLEAHAAYAVAARHVEFIEKHRGNWAGVRVFDSEVHSR